MLNHVRESIDCKQALLTPEFEKQLLHAKEIILRTVYMRGKVFLVGNGGSAADCLHIEAELTCKYKSNRRYPIFATTLCSNPSYITAVSNDFSFQDSYARYIRYIGRTEDTLIALSTSGNSINISKVIEEAAVKQMGLIVLLGGNQNSVIHGMLSSSSLANTQVFSVSSTNTPIIQESHIMIGHILCGLIDEALFHEENSTDE